jgi:hypothetical protein
MGGFHSLIFVTCIRRYRIDGTGDGLQTTK